jgi:hypothetical protein
MFAPDKILTLDKNGTAWIMDISGAASTFTRTSGVGQNRAWSNLTDLADGTVLLTGGSNGLGPSGQGNVATETNNAEIWDPATGQWTNDAAPQLVASITQIPCSYPMVLFYRPAAAPLAL